LKGLKGRTGIGRGHDLRDPIYDTYKKSISGLQQLINWVGEENAYIYLNHIGYSIKAIEDSEASKTNFRRLSWRDKIKCVKTVQQFTDWSIKMKKGMNKIKSFVLALAFVLSFATGVNAEFFKDIIITGPNAIWTDSRAYTTLNDAISAVGSSERTIVIASPQTVTSLTVPANVTLKFERNGSISNSGQLTINTKNIIADNRQIFTGAGDIDFAAGTKIKSSWFSTSETAFSITSDDTVTLVITKPQTLTTNCSVGNNVVLEWEGPGNILTANAGVIVSNIGQIKAGPYQLFAGAGNFDFVAGSVLKSSWFASLRSADTFTDDEDVNLTIVVDKSETVDYDFNLRCLSRYQSQQRLPYYHCYCYDFNRQRTI